MLQVSRLRFDSNIDHARVINICIVSYHIIKSSSVLAGIKRAGGRLNCVIGELINM